VSACRARCAKELSVVVLEGDGAVPCSHLEHANYLGREFQKAEFALLLGEDYVQD
jgi:dihydropteroate synthase